MEFMFYRILYLQGDEILIPRPPELLTAAASSGPVTKHIGAQMIGTLIPNRLQIRV